jgi:hypothetical protein
MGRAHGVADEGDVLVAGRHGEALLAARVALSHPPGVTLQAGRRENLLKKHPENIAPRAHGVRERRTLAHGLDRCGDKKVDANLPRVGDSSDVSERRNALGEGARDRRDVRPALAPSARNRASAPFAAVSGRPTTGPETWRVPCAACSAWSRLPQSGEMEVARRWIAPGFIAFSAGVAA